MLSRTILACAITALCGAACGGRALEAGTTTPPGDDGGAAGDDGSAAGGDSAADASGAGSGSKSSIRFESEKMARG